MGQRMAFPSSVRMSAKEITMNLKMLLSGVLLLASLYACANTPDVKRGFLDWHDVVYDPDGTIRCDQAYCK
jgi:hypothetical protein